MKTMKKIIITVAVIYLCIFMFGLRFRHQNTKERNRYEE